LIIATNRISEHFDLLLDQIYDPVFGHAGFRV
jgi:hypothetical protein